MINTLLRLRMLLALMLASLVKTRLSGFKILMINCIAHFKTKKLRLTVTHGINLLLITVNRQKP